MADVFISYSSNDKPVADAIVEAVERAGVKCWVAPRDIPPASNYAEQILIGIEQCRVMVVVLSAHANESEHVFREVERAVSRGLPILPFRIEDVQPSRRLELFLSSTQWVDGFPGPVESRTEPLVHGLQTLLAGSGPVRRRPSSAPPAPKKRKRLGAILIAALVVAALGWLAIWLGPCRGSEAPELALEIAGRAVDPGRVRLVGGESLVLSAVGEREIGEKALIEHTGFDVTSSATTAKGRKWTLQQQKPLRFEFEARFVVKSEPKDGVLSCTVRRDLIDSAVGARRIDGKPVGNAAVVTVDGFEADIELVSAQARQFAKAFASLSEEGGAVVVRSIPLANANDDAGLTGRVVLPRAARQEGKRFVLELTAEDSVGAQRTAKVRRPLIEFGAGADPGPGTRPPRGSYPATRDPANACRYTVDVRGLGLVSVTKVFVDGARNGPKFVKITPPWSRTPVARAPVPDGQNPWSGNTNGLNDRRDFDGKWILELEARTDEDCGSIAVTALRFEFTR